MDMNTVRKDQGLKLGTKLREAYVDKNDDTGATSAQ